MPLFSPSPLFFLSAFLTMGVFVAAGIFIGNRSKGSGDFALGGRKTSTAGVTGVLLGALVGGASTVGTAQMAYSVGLSAIWFTAGGGIGCLLLGLSFAKPIRESRITTISDCLEQSYGWAGRRLSLLSVFSSSLGTIISVCAQLMSCIALLSGLFSIPAWSAAVISALLVLGFIATSGLKGFSRLGGAKIILLYAVLIACVLAAIKNGGTFSAVTSALPTSPWFNPFGRGLALDLGAIASMVVGIITTQIYVQSLVAAKDARTARTGALLSALLMPTMGLLSVWVGLSVRASGAVVPANLVLPIFIMESFTPFAAGIIWGGIMVCIIGCAAGLLLGVSTNVTKNLLPERLIEGEARSAAAQRIVIAAILLLAVFVAVHGKNAMILEIGYLGLGLRGAGTFLPFVLAIVSPGSLPPKWALASCVGGIAAMTIWWALRLPGDPLFAGLALSFVCAAVGVCTQRQLSRS